MATNDFLPFAVGGSANVLSQSAYAALSAIANGYSSGVAQSAALNKTWRQSSIMAAVLAQFIADETGANSVDDGTTATLLANLKKATPGRLLAVQQFNTASGTFTYTPTSGMKFAIVEVQGAGGAAGGTSAVTTNQFAIGGGGGSGSYAKVLLTAAQIGASQTVTIGAGGTGVAGANGNAGAASSFGTLISCPGGTGGPLGGPATGGTAAFNPQAAGGAAPTISTGTVLVSTPGLRASPAGTAGTGGLIIPMGAGSPLANGGGGGNGGGVTFSAAPGSPGTAPGAGGGGPATATSAAAQAGGAGLYGAVIVWEFGSN